MIASDLHRDRVRHRGAALRAARALPSASLSRNAGIFLLVSAAIYIAFGLTFSSVPEGSGATFWEAVIATSQDPYPLIYALWPALFIVCISSQAGSLSPLRLIRRGSMWVTALSEAIRGAAMGVAAGVGAILGSAIVSRGNGLQLAWSSFALSSDESSGSQVLAPFASAGVPALAALLVPVIAWSGALSALAAALSLVARASVTLQRVSSGLSILLPPVLFRVQPFGPVANPVSFLLPAHAIAQGIPLWAFPALAYAAAGLVVLGAYLAWRESGLLDFVRSARGIWAIAVAVLTVLLFLRAPSGATVAEAIFYGASSEGFSFPYWAYAVVVWQGLALVSLTRWSGWVLPRFSLVALRTGSAYRVIVREVFNDVKLMAVSTAALLLCCAAIGALIGLPPASWADWAKIGLGGVASSMVTMLLCLACVWVSGRIQAAAFALVIIVATTLPTLNPLWPWPAASGFLGAWTSVQVAGPAAGIALASVLLLLVLSKFGRLPEVDVS
ncbi:hypothetical protein [Brachybacterium kimchii]|uniref:Polyketide antibiotic transporter n=1 Tax=Brachybacterium kimchii TaxID=2942909 RepID=A0ABY4ND48_9MICO|nr:hypothetical protein [Brachybacterium kimchii]UQN31523.1 hypothetical protein M4486_09715 [Brachybacterium kimchii]